MKLIRKILERYTAWLWHILGPLGPWGVFVVTACDGAFLGLPVDAVIAGYVYHDHAHLMFYITMASAGSAIGSSVLYLIGFVGGEALLRKRMSPAHYQKIHASFEKHEFWALMLPAMLPPPTPFKLFVLAAAVAEMRFVSFLAAIFAGRFIRFAILGFLTIRFGPQVVRFVADVFRRHWLWVLIAIVAGVVVWIILLKRSDTKEAVTATLPGKKF